MKSFASVFVATLAASLSCEASVIRRATPLPPSLDPFYTPPSGFESTAPGTVLRNRTITPSFLANINQAYQLLYRTTAINGSAIASVTTIFKPSSPALDKFVHFQTAYDSSATSCDPSFTYQFGSNGTGDAITSFETGYIGDYLNDGYIVASADYEGPDAAFSPGRLEGPNVLDSMRAVSNFGSVLGLTTDSPAIVGAGYSGGAIATAWAAALQPSYAPELNIKGWAAGGTPANLTGTLVFIDNTFFSGFEPPAVVGLLAPSAYGAELTPLLNRVATAEGRAALDYAASHCAVDDLTNFSYKSILSTDFQTDGYGLLYEPEVVDVLAKCTLGLVDSETPTAPTLIYHAVQDEIIPFANASFMVDSWCRNGAAVNFTVFENGGHAGTEISGFAYQQSFVEAAFAGNVIQNGCVTTNVTASGALSLRTVELPEDGVARGAVAGYGNTLLEINVPLPEGKQ